MKGTYQMQINLYDNNLYLDKNEVSEKWDTTFLLKHYEEDIVKLNKLAKEHIYRWNCINKQQLMVIYAGLYKNLLELYCTDFIKDIQVLESYKHLEKEEDIGVYFGGYLEKLHGIYPIGSEKEG